MDKLITGIHHVTAIASNAQKNLDFYNGVLGLRLVKQTVNFDNSSIYHFYFGNDQGSPGTLLTFFPYPTLPNGRHGKGMLNTTSFSVPISSLNYWLKRFKQFDVLYKMAQERFIYESVVYFEDEDGLGLELVFNDRDERPGIAEGPVPQEHAIKGIYHVEIWVDAFERTAGLMTTQLDHQLIIEKGNRFRFAATNAPGNYVDLICSSDVWKGLAGTGTVDHVAFSTPNLQTQEAVRQKVQKWNPTTVRDRQYFSSIYFREPGGVLFEVATAGPGFATDEPLDTLGASLKLPPQYESDRENIEKALPPVTVHLHHHYH
jgi:glyoxalase family protein